MPGRKFHVSLNVANLQEAVGFFGRFFRMHPTKMYPDYAKFEVEDPPLVLSLEPKADVKGASLNHLGVRVNSHEELKEISDGLMQLGLSSHFMADVECCYSMQTKIALNDSDQNLWEVYVLDKDIEKAAITPVQPNVQTSVADEQGTSKAASEPQQKASYEHLLGSPLNIPLEQNDASLDEINLRGTFNAAKDFERRLSILSEVYRCLKPGGEITLHMLVSDQPVTKTLPKLPGPAALVDFTPVADDVLSALENAGFGAMTYKRYSHAPVFQFEGCAMRELLVSAVKLEKNAEVASEKFKVVYKGPFKSVSDDFGADFLRGKVVEIGSASFNQLQKSSLAESFVFLSEANDVCGA